MRIAITGASGFLGREILRNACSLEGVEMVAITSKPDYIRQSYGVTVIDNESFVNNDVNADRFDVLINCAFPRNEDPCSLASGLAYLEQVVRLVRLGCTQAVIDVSSQSVYSQYRSAAAIEQSAIALETRYSVAKYAMELLFNSCGHEVACTHIRLASLIGPGFDQRLPNKLVRQMMNGESVIIHDSGQLYGYMDVRDAANAILKLATSCPSTWKPVYVLGNKGGYTIHEIAKTAQKVVEGIKGISPRVSFSHESKSNILNTTLDASLFYDSLKWLPRFSLVDSLTEIVLFEDTRLGRFVKKG